MVDKFPADAISDLDNVIAAVDGPPAPRQPLLAASAGWIMRDMATPASPPTNDVHIYAKSGRLYAKSTLGDVPLLTQATASNVADAPALTSSSIGAAPTQSDYNLLRADVAALRTAHNNLTATLRLGGLLV